MMLCFAVAKELGMTVSQLLVAVTEEELIGWSAFLEIQNDEMEKATRGRGSAKRR